MKSPRILVLVGGLFIFLFSSLVYAGVPQMINYQGKITTPTGALVDTVVQMTFTIYDDSTSGNVLWADTLGSVSVQKGIFSVLLGSVNPIPDSVFDGNVRYLGVKVGTDVEMTPRKAIVSVGYAYKSEYADTAQYANVAVSDGDWYFRVTDTADTTLMTGGEWGITRAGNTLYGNSDSTHVNLGVACTTGTSVINTKYCTVGGGKENSARWYFATVGGGYRNTAAMEYATVAGGESNTAGGANSTVGGGYNNNALEEFSTIAGGQSNTASGENATIGGGNGNTASGLNATVGGGLENTASGYGATVPGGGTNTADGEFSLAAGYGVVTSSDAYYTIAFGREFTTSTPNAVIFHNSETPIKVGIGTTAPDEALHVQGNIKMVDGNQAAGKVMTSDANGVGFWQAGVATGLVSVDGVSNAGGDVDFIQQNAITITPNDGANTVTFGETHSGRTDNPHAVTAAQIGAIGGSGTANYIPKFTASTTLSNSVIYETSSKIGIGTTSPDAGSKLHVQHDNLYAGYFTSNYLNGNTKVIHSEFTGLGNYGAIAVYGKSRPADDYGCGGYFEGGDMGVAGEVLPTGSALYYGVFGFVNGGSGTNYGVFGFAGGTGTNWAGYFMGNAKVTGTLTKGGGAFQIDHPLDPENKYLFHSFVESPDMMNVYNGNVILDANGEATVQLPDYFEALNRDFRYQLTAIGAPGPNLYISQEISENSFKIAGGAPGMKVSWQVTGIRHDKFAEANRIQVEVDKPDNERGKYLHPEAYNLGEEYDIHYEQNKQMKERMEKEKME